MGLGIKPICLLLFLLVLHQNYEQADDYFSFIYSSKVIKETRSRKKAANSTPLVTCVELHGSQALSVWQVNVLCSSVYYTHTCRWVGDFMYSAWLLGRLSRWTAMRSTMFRQVLRCHNLEFDQRTMRLPFPRFNRVNFLCFSLLMGWEKNLVISDISQ